eukprot:132475-Chlamydomonas_euryale.AAC.1
MARVYLRPVWAPFHPALTRAWAARQSDGAACPEGGPPQPELAVGLQAAPSERAAGWQGLAGMRGDRAHDCMSKGGRGSRLPGQGPRMLEEAWAG